MVLEILDSKSSFIEATRAPTETLKVFGLRQECHCRPFVKEHLEHHSLHRRVRNCHSPFCCWSVCAIISHLLLAQASHKRLKSSSH